VLHFREIQSNYLNSSEKSLIFTSKTSISVGMINFNRGISEVSTENIKNLAKKQTLILRGI